MSARSGPPAELDPFGTAALRRAVLDAWAASPARFREDANAEEALATGGYADRLLVELAANGVDAALEAGVPGRVRFTLDLGGPVPELRAANVGAPLTPDGVAGLASLRASAKRGGSAEPGSGSRSTAATTATVGHFGVGFTAVLTVSTCPSVVSTTGSVRFSDIDTADAVAGLAVGALEAEVAARGGQVPVLRLPFTGPAADLPDGFDTQVRLPLRDGVLPAVQALLDGLGDELLWALPGLRTVEVERPDRPLRVITRADLADGRTVITDDGVDAFFRSVTRRGMVPAALLAGRPVEERGRSAWHLTWVLPDVDEHAGSGLDFAAPRASEPLFLGAPTPTDEPLSLPARLVGTFPVDDTRRRLATGALTRYLLDEAAAAYCELLPQVPVERRLSLVPAAGFPVGPVDAALREDVVRRLSDSPVLTTAGGSPVRPVDACVITGIPDAAAVLVGRAVPGLLPPPRTPAELAALRVLGVPVLPLADATTALAGIDGPPRFWREIYAALADQHVEDLANLPVPLAGGGRRIGPAGCLLPGPDAVDDQLLERAARVAEGLRIVHPEAAHPLLARLGAVPADLPALLGDPALADVYRRFREDLEDTDPDPAELDDLAALALDLAATLGPVDAGAPPPGPLADVVLTDADGEAWPASELLAPGAPLAAVLASDADLPLVGQRWLRYPERALSAVGVRTGLRVVRVTDEDADLPDLPQWWSEVVGDGPPPEPFDAVADLDLIDDRQWPRFLELLGADRAALHALMSGPEPSYTRWWLSRFSLLSGAAPTAWRLPGTVLLAGLYDELPPGIDPGLARSIGALGDAADAVRTDPAELVHRLADPDRRVAAGVVPVLTALAVDALEGNPDIALPGSVRTLSGEVVDADDAVVLDVPWLAQVLDASSVVAGGADPDRVARVLDLELASHRFRARVGNPATGADDPGPATDLTADQSAAVDRAALVLRSAVQPGTLRVVPELSVRLEGETVHRVSWWPAGGSVGMRAGRTATDAGRTANDAGRASIGAGLPGRSTAAVADGSTPAGRTAGAAATFLTDGSAEGIGRVVAWVLGQWAERHRAVAAARGVGSDLLENGVG